jgi:hypothetical protein
MDNRSTIRSSILGSPPPIYPSPDTYIVLFMKLWVVVYNYGLINEDVDIFSSLEDARDAFREYTGFEWDEERRWKDYGGEEYSKEYGECDVFECKIG